MGTTRGSGHDWPTWQVMAHKDQHEPHQGSTVGGLGIILELEGSSEGGDSSVERNRQNKELFSNKILQMDQSNTTNKSFSHSVWQTITLFNVYNTIAHFSSGTFGSLYIIKRIKDALLCVGRGGRIFPQWIYLNKQRLTHCYFYCRFFFFYMYFFSQIQLRKETQRAFKLEFQTTKLKLFPAN